MILTLFIIGYILVGILIAGLVLPKVAPEPDDRGLILSTIVLWPLFTIIIVWPLTSLVRWIQTKVYNNDSK